MDKLFKLYASLLGLGFVLSLFACQTSLSPEAYVKWVQDPSNGLRKEKQIGEYQLVAQLLPTDYQLLNPNYAAATPKQQKIWEADANKALTFQLALRTNPEETSVLTHPVSSTQDYQERINYMAFEMERDLYLICGSDTLRPQLYHYERTFNLSRELRCMMSFDRPATLAEKATLVLDDQLMGVGPVHFPIALSSLEQPPQLKR